VKVVVSGGGTGGHTLPVIAVINSLNQNYPNLEIIFIGSRFGIESKLIPKIGVKYYGISAGKFRRYHRSMILNIIDPTTLFKNIKDFFNFIKGIKEAYNILAHEKPDVVFAKGGYVSLPVGISARLKKIPLVIHESDLVMGMANRRISPHAQRVCVSFPKKNYPDISKEVLEYTGNPVRDDITAGRGEEFKKSIGFSGTKKTVLILGGSQGSQFINELVINILENLLDVAQVIWIAGERDVDWISYEIKNKIPKEMQQAVRIFGFVGSEIGDIYAASDLVISRAGSNVLFEMALLGKPTILIPLGSSAGGHQYENARYFSRHGGAYIFNQNGLQPKKVFNLIKYLFDNPDELVILSNKIKTLANSSAASLVADIIYDEGTKQVEQIAKSKKQI
jgi:UDP-N-acetylglucosamine--N-acetylmuramyl-(pentapeptide) pyrophosphoryl-undecaprenol N-acetylglucosamine transferase